jgi:hypothetical protein
MGEWLSVVMFFAGVFVGCAIYATFVKDKILGGRDSEYNHKRDLRRMSMKDRVTTKSSKDNDERARITQSKMNKRPGQNFS